MDTKVDEYTTDAAAEDLSQTTLSRHTSENFPEWYTDDPDAEIWGDEGTYHFVCTELRIVQSYQD
jgi:hypothetical protein